MMDVTDRAYGEERCHPNGGILTGFAALCNPVRDRVDAFVACLSAHTRCGQSSPSQADALGITL
jgi:hypothetical protein